MNDERILELLASIAASLAEISRNTQRELPEEPNLQRPIEAYLNFDWPSIEATVVKSDEFGPAIVEWGGRLWTRRAPENKFGEAIWFSRSAGRDETGANHYLRLISFKRVSDAEPISRSAERALRTVQPPAATVQPPAATVQPPAATALSSADAEFDRLISATQRPRSPELVRKMILTRASKQCMPQNDEGRDRQRLWAALTNLCENQNEPIRDLLAYFYGPNVSTKTLTRGQCLAIVEWVNATKQTTGEYIPDAHAIAEYAAIRAQFSARPNCYDQNQA